MVRNKVDPCMFCGGVPCECNKAAPKAKKAPAPRKQSAAKKVAAPVETAPTQAFDPLAAMRAVAVPNQVIHTTPSAAAPEIEADPEDMEFCAAVAALDPILHPTEQRRFAVQIERGKELLERRRSWVERMRG